MTDRSSIAWLGLDAHSQNCVLAHLDNAGHQRGHWRFPTTPEQLFSHLDRIPVADKRLVLEESNLARWLGGLLRPKVTQLVVCDARHNRLICAHPNKKDDRDAFALARLFRLGEIHPIWQQTDDQRALFKMTAHQYEQAVARQSRLKVQLKGRFQHWGLFPTGTTVFSLGERKAWLDRLPLPGARPSFELLYLQMDQAVEAQRGALRQMVQLARRFPEVELLKTMPGVGRVGACLFVACIQDPTRFSTLQHLTRFARLGIIDRSSDNKPLGYQRLDSHGHGLLKAITYRGWLQATKKKSGPIWESFENSLQRTGSQVHARLNTQRKILLTLWTMWLKNQPFEAEKFFSSRSKSA